MRQIVFAITLAAGACAHASAQWSPPPAPLAALEHYLADYVSVTDTLYVREAHGNLEAVLDRASHALRPLAGDTFLLDGERVVLGGDRVIVHGTALEQRRYERGTFHIQPRKPVAELRAIALAAAPPPQPASLLPVDLVELQALAPGIKYDIRYATTNNFMGAVFYASATASLQRPAAEAVARVHRRLAANGYGLLVFDAYRPWYVTKMFWDATPDSLRDFVADPAVGSRHNRGAAVDLTLYDLNSGRQIEMPSGYDEFSERAHPDYPGGSERQRWHRELLRKAMEAEGFTVYEVEWWHFDYRNWRRYPVR